ncbi:MAG: hypothetical protein IJZ74_09535 [Clostridia bacterium]|nr:hypothetical protein [Clostridia bacterium]
MEAIRIAGFAVCAAVMAMLLRRMRPEAGMGLVLAAGVITLTLILPMLSQVISGITSLARTGGVSDSYMTQLLKVGGVSLLMDFASQTCRDAGEDGLAMKVDLAGRVVLISLALPFMQALLTQIMSLS